jgi:hypothetical protein
MTKLACHQASFSDPAIKNGRNLQSLKASTDTKCCDEDKAKAEPLLTLPFREKRV